MSPKLRIYGLTTGKKILIFDPHLFYLYKYDVFITPGTIFGSNGEGYIRFSLCVDEDKILEVLKRVSKSKSL